LKKAGVFNTFMNAMAAGGKAHKPQQPAVQDPLRDNTFSSNTKKDANCSALK
jgi:hypothetical protein